MRVLLRHRETQATRCGRFCAMSSLHLSRAQSMWLAAFDQLLQAGQRHEDSLLWERGFMSRDFSGAQGAPSGHVVLSSGRIEGIVVTVSEPQPSRIDPYASLVYVRYLATAPWNRVEVSSQNGFFGIGRLLVGRFVLDSVLRGHDGRIGLHSLRASNSFYDALGFTSLGADPVRRGMTLYELQPESALLALLELQALLIHDPEIL